MNSTSFKSELNTAMQVLAIKAVENSTNNMATQFRGRPWVNNRPPVSGTVAVHPTNGHSVDTYA